MVRFLNCTGLCLILLAGFPLFGFAQQKAADTYKTVKTVPAVTLTDLKGGTFSSASVQPKGKPLVVIYFSPTCGHCLEFTEELTRHLKDFKQVQFLMVSAYPPADIQTFVITRGIHKMSNFKVGHDASFDMGRFYDLKEIPSIFVYGSNGILKKSFVRAVPIADLQKAVQ